MRTAVNRNLPVSRLDRRLLVPVRNNRTVVVPVRHPVRIKIGPSETLAPRRRVVLTPAPGRVGYGFAFGIGTPRSGASLVHPQIPQIGRGGFGGAVTTSACTTATLEAMTPSTAKSETMAILADFRTCLARWSTSFLIPHLSDAIRHSIGKPSGFPVFEVP